MRLILIGTLLVFASSLAAQVKVNATATGRHAKTVNRAKKVRELTRERKAQLKLLKDHRKATASYQESYTNLKNQKLEISQPDSLSNLSWTRQDSLSLSREILYESNFPDKYKQVLLDPINIDSLRSVMVGKQTVDLEQEAENRAGEYLPEELSGAIDVAVPTQELTTVDVKGFSKPNPNLVKPEAARELFRKIDPESFKQAQTDLTKLKKKYTEMPDARFPAEGRKRNSLEDIPFKKRLYLGGMFNVSSTDPLILDMNLQLGYRINKKWMSGAGFSFREQLTSADSTNLFGDGHGFSIFSKYNILKQFHAWGEIQRQTNQSTTETEVNTVARWQSAYLLGVGREFNLGPARMSSLLMYDFNHQQNTLSRRPWVVRIGMILSGD